MEDVGRGLSKEDVTWLGIAGEGCEDDTILIAFDEGSHAHSGRGESHLFSFAQQSCYFGNQYIVVYFHSAVYWKQLQSVEIYVICVIYASLEPLVDLILT